MVSGFLDIETVSFEGGNVAHLVRVSKNAETEQIVSALNLPSVNGLIILNGGTKEIESQVRERIEQLFGFLVRFITEQKICVITGGTDAGIFALFGKQAKQIGRAAAPCIGVVPGRGVESAGLEPHHSHFVIIESADWGDETQIMYRLAEDIAKGRPSLSVFAGGGQITLNEMLENIRWKREMVFIAGTRGSTDAVVTGLCEHSLKPGSQDKIAQIRREGKITVLQDDQSPEEFVALISERMLKSQPETEGG